MIYSGSGIFAIFSIRKLCRIMPIFLIICFSCKNQNQNKKIQSIVTERNIFPSATTDFIISGAGVVTKMEMNILSIFQDKNDNYWFGTNTEGVYRYNGNSLIQYTYKEGLCNNQIRRIQEDKIGNIWFTTGEGVSRFDGNTFITFPGNQNILSDSSAAEKWKSETNVLWFESGSGVFKYAGEELVYLPIPGNTLTDQYRHRAYGYASPFTVHCSLTDKSGALWFGTQTLGLCRYDGKNFTWFTEKGLSNSAILALFEDRQGNIWIGNNGAGLFRYDGKELINFTQKKGADYSELTQNRTMSRIYTINEDDMGNLWIGTIDAGVWRFDGVQLRHFTMENGLASNAIHTIYKDKQGELWFGTQAGICKFNGNEFTKFAIR